MLKGITLLPCKGFLYISDTHFFFAKNMLQIFSPICLSIFSYHFSFIIFLFISLKVFPPWKILLVVSSSHFKSFFNTYFLIYLSVVPGCGLSAH